VPAPEAFQVRTLTEVVVGTAFNSQYKAEPVTEVHQQCGPPV